MNVRHGRASRTVGSIRHPSIPQHLVCYKTYSIEVAGVIGAAHRTADTSDGCGTTLVSRRRGHYYFAIIKCAAAILKAKLVWSSWLISAHWSEVSGDMH